MVSSFVAPADDNRLRSKRQMALDRHRQDVWWIRIGQHFRVSPCFVLSPTPPILIYIYSFTTTLNIVCIYTRAGALCAQARGKILPKQNRLKSILNFSDLQILLRQNGDFGILLRQKLWMCWLSAFCEFCLSKTESAKHWFCGYFKILPKQNGVEKVCLRAYF